MAKSIWDTGRDKIKEALDLKDRTIRIDSGNGTAPVAPGSGLTRQGGLSSKDKILTVENKAIFPDEDEVSAITEAIRRQPEFQAQAKGQEIARNMLALNAEFNKPQIDLTPAMVLADAWGEKGVKNAANYKAPKNDAYDKAIAYNAKIQDDQRDLAKNLMAAVSALKLGTSQSQKLSEITATMGNKAQDPKMRASGSGVPQQASYDRELRANLDKLSNSVTGHKQQLDLLQSAVGSKKYDQVAAVLAQFARGVSGEKGVLTEGDLRRTMPRNWQGDWAKLESYFNDTPTADLDPAYVKGLLEMSKRARAETYKMFHDQIGTKKSLYTNSPYFNENAKKNLQALEGLVEQFNNAPMDEKEAIRAKMKAIEQKLGIQGPSGAVGPTGGK